jgi:methylenetetrahydrofolate dehydrogenase (NADP+)/methenyltetrahydrofolate cyclohydrolase
MAMLLEQAGATVTLCHSGTRDLPAEVARAELLVAALGRPAWIQAGWLAQGAVVVDVGIHPRPGGGLIGDVDMGPALERLSAVTPVPGGVGPMTVAMLMENTLRAAEARLRG